MTTNATIQHGYSQEDKLKLYMIARAEAVFGPGCVSRILTQGDMLSLFMTTHGTSSEAMEASLKQCFSRKLFQDKAAPNAVKVTHKGYANMGDPDEQMGCVVLKGNLTDIAATVEKQNPALFAACADNKGAQEVLRRQPMPKIGEQGIVMPVFSNKDKLLLYYIDKIQKAYGADAVTGIDTSYGTRVYYYVTSNPRDKDAVKNHVSPIDPQVMSGHDADSSVHASSVMVNPPGFSKLDRSDEQLFNFFVTGPLTEMVTNVEKYDGAAFLEAQRNPAAQETLKKLQAKQGALGK